MADDDDVGLRVAGSEVPDVVADACESGVAVVDLSSVPVVVGDGGLGFSAKLCGEVLDDAADFITEAAEADVGDIGVAVGKGFLLVAMADGAQGDDF